MSTNITPYGEAGDISNTPAGDISSTDIQDAINELAIESVMVSDIKDQSFENLIVNGDFESWSGGVSANPDGWVLAGAGSSVARSTTHKISKYSAALTRAGTDITLFFDAPDPNRYAYRTVSLGVWVYATTGNCVRLMISDGVSYSACGYHPGDSTWHWLSVSRSMEGSATRCRAELIIRTADTIAYFDGAIMVEGSVCPAFSLKSMPSPSLITSAPTDTGYDGEIRIYSTGGNRRIYISDGSTWKYIAVVT